MDFSRREGDISILDFVIKNICKKIFGGNSIATAHLRHGNGGKILATAL